MLVDILFLEILNVLSVPLSCFSFSSGLAGCLRTVKRPRCFGKLMKEVLFILKNPVNPVNCS